MMGFRKAVAGPESPQESSAEPDFSAEVNRAATWTVERYGEAVAEHFRSLEGLERISGHRVHPDYAQSNLRQQAGYSAEYKHVARTNAESRIARSGATISRTDDVGYVNHEVADFVTVDRDGRPLLDADGGFKYSGQMKVYGKVEKYQALYKQEYQHYKSAELLIPQDQYGAVMRDWDAQQASLERQCEALKRQGRHADAVEKQKLIEQLRDAKSRAKESPVTSQDAMEARLSPNYSAAKDIADLAHRGGMEAAKMGAALGGGVSLFRNVVAAYQAGKPLDEAAIDVAADTGKAAAAAYASGAISSALGGALQSSGSVVMQNLGRGGTPAALVQVAQVLAGSTLDLIRGRVTSEEFVRQVGREGSMLAVSMTGSSFGAMVGTAVLPGVGTVIGGMLGGMVVSCLSGQLHAELMRSVAAMDESNKLRQRTQAMCDHIVRQHEGYRQEMHALFDHFFAEKRQELKSGFDAISTASLEGRSIHDGLEVIARAMGKKLAFASTTDMVRHLRSGTALEL